MTWTSPRTSAPKKPALPISSEPPTTSERPATDLRALVATDVLDAELASLVWVLAERGVPLVVAGTERVAAETLRRAFVDQVRATQPARDAVAGGVVVGGSLLDVLRVLGGGTEISDDTRDLGVVLIIREGRVSVAHYVRPVERDAAGHLQRRPPAVLSARATDAGALEHFYWAFTEELATRAAITRHELEDEQSLRSRRLAPTASQPNARN